MTAISDEPRQGVFKLTGAKVAVLGYDGDAREHALALRGAGNTISVGLPPGRTHCARAEPDGVAAEPASAALEGAQVVLVNVRDDEQPATFWRDCVAHVAPGALVVFRCGLGIETTAFEPPGADIVLVVGGNAACRIAVHRDGTGRALVRAFAYARAAFGHGVAIDGTTVAAEADLELAAVGERVGGLFALLGSQAPEAETKGDRADEPASAAGDRRPPSNERSRT